MIISFSEGKWVAECSFREWECLACGARIVTVAPTEGVYSAGCLADTIAFLKAAK